MFQRGQLKLSTEQSVKVINVIKVGCYFVGTVKEFSMRGVCPLVHFELTRNFRFFLKEMHSKVVQRLTRGKSLRDFFYIFNDFRDFLHQKISKIPKCFSPG